MSRRYTAVIAEEEGGYVALCPELDVVSQGPTWEAARDNLREALELFLECAPPEEISRRAAAPVVITEIEVGGG